MKGSITCASYSCALCQCAFVIGLAFRFAEGIPTALATVHVSSSRRPGRTGILVHGCHLQAVAWSEIVFGNVEKQQLGRVSQAALLALEEDPVCIVFGTGGSHKDGKPEGQHTLDFLFENFSRLKLFRAFDGVDLSALETRMRACSVAEVQSLNTVEELKRGGDIMVAKGVDRIILISSPTHISRCLRDAVVAYHGRDLPFQHRIFACPSGTCYHNSSADEVAIVEPPHRGDRDVSLDNPPMHKLVATLCAMAPAKRRDVLIKLEETLKSNNVS